MVLDLDQNDNEYCVAIGTAIRIRNDKVIN